MITTIHMISLGAEQLITQSEDASDIIKLMRNLHTFSDQVLIRAGLQKEGKFVQDQAQNQDDYSPAAAAAGEFFAVQLATAMAENDNDLMQFGQYVETNGVAGFVMRLGKAMAVAKARSAVAYGAATVAGAATAGAAQLGDYLRYYWYGSEEEKG